MSVWERSAFVATPGNVPLELVPDTVTRLFVQVAWGTKATPVDEEWLALARASGLELYAWAWCNGESVEGEAEVHAQAAQGYPAFCANLEEPYDAHGDAANPKFGLPARYLAALDWEGPLALTTTPRFASDMTAWIARGALYCPQAFPLETGVGLTECVTFAQSWGWPLELIRPLVQSYPTKGLRPDPDELDAEATVLGVGGIPYTIEQAMDDRGAGLAGRDGPDDRPRATGRRRPDPSPSLSRRRRRRFSPSPVRTTRPTTRKGRPKDPTSSRSNGPSAGPGSSPGRPSTTSGTSRSPTPSPTTKTCTGSTPPATTARRLTTSSSRPGPPTRTPTSGRSTRTRSRRTGRWAHPRSPSTGRSTGRTTRKAGATRTAPSARTSRRSSGRSRVPGSWSGATSPAPTARTPSRPARRSSARWGSTRPATTARRRMSSSG